jgi:hypothetical protein
MGVLLSLASLILSLTATVGLSPLHTSAKVHLDAAFVAGTVCLIWESGDELATPGSDCWTFETSTQRTWVKPLTLRTGVYEVWVTIVGQDGKGTRFSAKSLHQRVEVD